MVDINGKLGNQSYGSPKAEGCKVNHFAIRIKPFVDQNISSHLAGFYFIVGEVVQRYGADGDGSSIYISDPDSNTIELKGPPLN